MVMVYGTTLPGVNGADDTACRVGAGTHPQVIISIHCLEGICSDCAHYLRCFGPPLIKRSAAHRSGYITCVYSSTCPISFVPLQTPAAAEGVALRPARTGPRCLAAVVSGSLICCAADIIAMSCCRAAVQVSSLQWYLPRVVLNPAYQPTSGWRCRCTSIRLPRDLPVRACHPLYKSVLLVYDNTCRRFSPPVFGLAGNAITLLFCALSPLFCYCRLLR